LVSIILPLYNSGPFLVKRLDSILNQSFSDFELIILDDFSQDNSIKIAESFLDNRIKLILKNRINSGSPFGLWERAFRLAKGDLIWIAEADDFCDSDFLYKLVEAFEDSKVVVSHCRSFDYRSEDNYKKNQWWDSFDEDIWDQDFVADGRDLIRKYGRFKCPVINVSSAVFRKSALEGIEIPSDYKYCGDWWFWAQIFQSGKVAYIAEPLNFIRIHENSATSYNNLNLLWRAIEATEISYKINDLSKTRFHYSTNYYWLVDFWVSALLGIKEFETIKKFIQYIPKSFFMPVFKRVFRHYKQKLNN
jgi:glycosyltransferase involved in cell wall biosynthesis